MRNPLEATTAPVIKRARRNTGLFDIERYSKISTINVTPEPYLTFDEPLAEFSVDILSEKKPKLRNIDELLTGPSESFSLHMTPLTRKYIKSICFSSQKQVPVRVNMGSVVAYVLAYAICHLDQWLDKTPADGRLTKSTVTVSGAGNRTTLSVPYILSNAIREVYEHEQLQLGMAPSIESLKLTGLVFGLSNYDRWKQDFNNFLVRIKSSS